MIIPVFMSLRDELKTAADSAQPLPVVETEVVNPENLICQYDVESGFQLFIEPALGAGFFAHDGNGLLVTSLGEVPLSVN